MSLRCTWMRGVTTGLLMAALSVSAFAQEHGEKKPDAKPAAKQDQNKAEPPAMDEKAMAEMMAQMEKLSTPGDNHKLLAGMVGDWAYTTKCWMDPSQPASESKGTMTCKSTYGGRYFIADHSGKFAMPGPDGKPVEKDFTGMSIVGYDNIKQQFVSAWIDNFGTGISTFTGTYDATKKTFTYTGTMECMPGDVAKVREVIKFVDKNTHVMEWYEDRGQGEMKTMEITYTRATPPPTN